MGNISVDFALNSLQETMILNGKNDFFYLVLDRPALIIMFLKTRSEACCEIDQCNVSSQSASCPFIR